MKAFINYLMEQNIERVKFSEHIYYNFLRSLKRRITNLKTTIVYKNCFNNYLY